MTDKVHPSFDRKARARETAAAIAQGGGSDGWIADGERLVEDSEGDLETGALSAFGHTTGLANFTIPGSDSFDISNSIAVVPKDMIWAFRTQDGSSGDQVFGYDFEGNQVENHDITPTFDNLQQNPQGNMVWDGTSFWILLAVEEAVEFDEEWNHTGTVEPFGSDISGVAATGIAWDGSSYWIVDTDGPTAREFDTSFNATGATFSITEQTIVSDFAYDGTNFWASNRGSFVYEYNVSSGYTGTALDVSGEIGESEGVGFTDHTILVSDRTTSDPPVYEYGQNNMAHSPGVVIQSGEAVIGGAYVARDHATAIGLPASTAGQDIAIGWKDSGSDDVLIGDPSSQAGDAFTADDQRITAWTFDTDSTSVTASSDLRPLNRRSNAEVVALGPVDVRALNDPAQGWVAYHDPSISGDANTEGPASYDGSAWTSLVDGTTIS